MSFILFLFACTAPDQFQVIDLVDNSYTLTHRNIDTLTSPKTMEGTLGRLFVGGIFELDWTTGGLQYSEGRALNVQFQTIDGIGHPVDRDGLIAFSFYAHLEDTVAFLESAEGSWDGLLPMNTAISPLISDLTLAFLPMENAAYVPTLHHFLILTDAIPKAVPLAANKGVVAHEFGHSIFHFLTTGGTNTDRLLTPDSEGLNSISSLDEGLADVLGYLVSQRPDFIADSLTDQDRALDGEHLAIDVPVLPEDYTGEGLLEMYNPYALGSVFAATVWEVADNIEDPTRMLNWIVDTTHQFGEEVRNGSREDTVNLGMQWLDVWVDKANSAEEQSLACQAIKARWEEVYEVATCLD